MRIDARLILRVNAMVCHSWGCTPHQLRLDCEAGLVAIEQVIETIAFVANTSAFADMVAYLQPEVTAAIRSKNERINALVGAYRSSKDPAERERIRSEMRKIQEETSDG